MRSSNSDLHLLICEICTKNIIDACTKLNMKRLIYTSSPIVVFDGIHGIFKGDETLPYPLKHNDSYSETKAEAEALVIKANGVNGLLTCCIRPSSIFGPGDKLLVPSLVAAARAGKSKAYTMAQNLDPDSEGRGVLQFKTGLMSVIKQKLAKKDGGRIDRNRDAQYLWDFLQDGIIALSCKLDRVDLQTT